jgi:uncharacterized protein YjiS (DUF1127 family)
MLRNLLFTLRHMVDRERIARRLRALDDRQLHDLGVSRDQIGAYVRAAARPGDFGGDLRTRRGA